MSEVIGFNKYKSARNAKRKAENRIRRRKERLKKEQLYNDNQQRDDNGYSLLYDGGWDSIKEMIETVLQHMNSGNMAEQHGAVLFLYTPEATTIYRCGLNLDEVKTLTEDYCSVVVDGLKDGTTTAVKLPADDKPDPPDAA